MFKSFWNAWMALSVTARIITAALVALYIGFQLGGFFKPQVEKGMTIAQFELSSDVVTDGSQWLVATNVSQDQNFNAPILKNVETTVFDGEGTLMAKVIGDCGYEGSIKIELWVQYSKETELMCADAGSYIIFTDLASTYYDGAKIYGVKNDSYSVWQVPLKYVEPVPTATATATSSTSSTK